MNRVWLGLAAALVLIAIGAYFWLQQTQQPLPPAPPVAAPPPVAPPTPITPPKPAIQHPVEMPPGMTDVPPVAHAGNFLKDRLTELLGAKNVKTFVLLEDFVRHVVATVDNLGRPLAPPRAWPIRTTPGRFTMERGSDGTYISANNAARYAPFVALVESVNADRAVALYRRLYPLFQSTYEGLGYPGKYFNDRLVEVIDLLLKTPEATAKLKVELPEIRGPLKPTHPWVLYRFSDPDLEALSSGQKILLRTGPDNEKRLKAKLAEIRKLVASGVTSR